MMEVGFSNSQDDAELSSLGLDMLAIPEPFQDLVRWMARQGSVTIAEIAAHLGQETETAREWLQPLISQGMVQVVTQEEANPDAPCHYRVHRVARRGRSLSAEIWQRLEEE